MVCTTDNETSRRRIEDHHPGFRQRMLHQIRQGTVYDRGEQLQRFSCLQVCEERFLQNSFGEMYGHRRS